MLFFYIRHGDPIYNPDSLTPLGRRQAEALGKRLARYGLDKIYASPLKRAQETAAPACELLKKEMTVLDWTSEALAWEEFASPDTTSGCTTWFFQNRSLQSVLVSPEMRALGADWFRHPALAGTRAAEGAARIRHKTDAFFASLGYVHNRRRCVYVSERPNRERVALFAHQGFGLAFLSSLLDIPYPLFSSHFDIGHSGMTVIEFSEAPGETVPRVLQLSNDAHIYSEGLPVKYQNRIDI